MTNIYYSLIGILAIVTHMIVNHGFYVRKHASNEDGPYRHYLFSILAYYVTDAAWGILNGTGNIVLLYVDTVLYYIAMAFSVVLCCRYIIHFLKLNSVLGRFLNTLGIIFACSEIVLLGVNHFHHFFFWFDEAGNYTAYSLRHAILIIQIVMFCFISLMSLKETIQQSGSTARRNRTISLFGLVMTFALCAQSLYPLMPLYTIGLMLGTLIIHVFIHNEELNAQLAANEELNAQLKMERESLLSQKEQITTALAIISALSRDYHSVWWANKEDMKLHMVRASKKTVFQEAIQIGLQEQDGNVAIKRYIETFVVPEERERILRQVNIQTVLNELSKSDFYGVNYLRINEKMDEDYNQMAFANATTEDGKQLLVFGFRDINDIIKQENALRKEINDARIAAEEANAAKTSFLFNMSHDIRTPMNAIIGFRNLLEKNQEDEQKRTSYLKKIEESSNVLLSIINNVLEMARIEKGVLELDESVWSAEQMNDSLYSVFADMMTQKGIQFTREIDVQHHYVWCDPTKTREIFFNIISNAYKYTKPGGRVHMCLKELPSDREGYAKYHTTISDTGIGMAEDFIPHLFEEFSRESNSTHSKIEGTGLGMPIVKRLVDFLGGSIEVKSKKGEGSTFFVTLYHRIGEKTMLAQAEAETQENDFSGKRILLAEDNELNAEIAIEILSAAGLEVERAIDGRDCVEKLTQAEAGYYNLILMDIQMPRMNGYEATQAIRALEDREKAQIKILAMTANAFEEDKREAAKAGMNGHLAKPINVRELFKAIAQTIH